MDPVGKSSLRGLRAIAAYALALSGVTLPLVASWQNARSATETVALTGGTCALLAIVLAKLSGATLVSRGEKFPASTQGSVFDVISIVIFLVRNHDLGRGALWLGICGLVWSIAVLLLSFSRLNPNS